MSGAPERTITSAPLPDDRTTSAVNERGLRSPAGTTFVPGTVFAGRYRVVSRLGQGGMGEVFRVEDLKVGQSAALKILSARLAGVPDLMEQFVEELRLSREVTHPSVCRVYDLGEHDGHHFITMEYVDGEDLASLLRRVGRLPVERALEVFTAIGAAVAAAHAKGVLHRDLKPANVMVDAQGRVRVMDFGLAVRAGQEREGEVAGTPAYMAPEQFEGKNVTARSDVYALGLILFELLTGKRPFTAASFQEFASRHRREAPPPPGSLVAGLDPGLEELVLRCLAKDPRDRPPSALAVVAALPGSDALTAILAAGGTPSPELLASLAETQTVAVRTVLALAGAAVAVVAGALFLGAQVSALRFAHLDKPPAALADRARELARTLGFPPPVDTATQIYADPVARAELNAGGREGYFPVMRFVYREAQAPLEAQWFRRFEESMRSNAAADYRRHRMSWFDVAPMRVTRFDPPNLRAGMLTMEMAPDGRLLAFRGVPAAGAQAAADWPPLLAAAGFEPTELHRLDGAEVRPWAEAARASAAGVDGDGWVAWTSSAHSARVLGGASPRGPVYFEVQPLHPHPPMRERIGSTTSLAVFGAVLLAAVVFVPRNLRTGRADRRGATRLAALVLSLYLVQWLLGASHVPTGHEMDSAANGAARGLFLAAVCWLAYVTVEPFVRRRWPGMLVSWSRLLTGRLADATVSRDVLIGTLMGGAGVLAFVAVAAVGPAFGWPVVYRIPPPDDLLGVRWAVSGRLGSAAAWLVQVMSLPLLLVIARRLLHSELVAGVAVALLISAGTWGASPSFAVGSTVLDLVLVFALLRFGLLAGVIAAVSSDLVLVAAFAFPAAGWAAPAWLVPLGALALLVAAALRGGLAGRDLAGLLDD